MFVTDTRLIRFAAVIEAYWQDGETSYDLVVVTTATETVPLGTDKDHGAAAPTDGATHAIMPYCIFLTGDEATTFYERFTALPSTINCETRAVNTATVVAAQWQETGHVLEVVTTGLETVADEQAAESEHTPASMVQPYLITVYGDDAALVWQRLGGSAR